MKTNVILIILVCVFQFTHKIKAQTVPNAGFEMWHTVGGWFDNPDNWNTNNNSIMVPSVVKDSSAYAGLLAMNVGNAAGLKGRAYTMFTLTTHPTAIKVYTKTNIAGSDSVKINIRLFAGGIEADSGYWFSSASVGAWTLVSIPLTQSSSTCDSMFIKVSGGNNTGTGISVDEFAIDYSMGISTEKKAANWSLYPNPFTESTLLSFENTSQHPLKLTIHNSLGELMQTISNITTTTVKIEKGNLTKGQYIITLSEPTGKIVLKEKLSVN